MDKEQLGDEPLAEITVLRRRGLNTEALTVLDGLEAAGGITVDTLCMRAKILASVGQFPEALALCDKATVADPRCPYGFYTEIYVLEKKGEDPDLIIGLIDRFLAGQPNDIKALILKAGLLRRTGKKDQHQFDETCRVCERILAIDPVNISALGHLAKTYEAFSKEPGDDLTQKAVEYNLRILEIVPNNVPAMYSLANLYCSTGDFQKALRYIDELLSGQPGGLRVAKGLYAKILKLRLKIIKSTKGTEGVQALIDEQLAKDPNGTSPYFIRKVAIYFIEKKQYQKARRYLFVLLKSATEEHQVGVLCLIGRTYIEEKNPKIAAKYYADALQIDPERVIALTGMAQALVARGDYSLATEYLETASKIAPDDEFVITSMIHVYLLTGNIRGAQECVKKTGGTRNPIVLTVCARVSYETGDYQGALRQIDEVLLIAPDDTVAKTFRTSVLSALGRLDESEAILRKLAKDNPADDKAIICLVTYLLGREKRTEALRLLTERTQNGPCSFGIIALFTRCVSPEDPVWDVLQAAAGEAMVREAKKYYDTPEQFNNEYGGSDGYAGSVFWKLAGTVDPVDRVASKVTAKPREGHNDAFAFGDDADSDDATLNS